MTLGALAPLFVLLWQPMHASPVIPPGREKQIVALFAGCGRDCRITGRR